MVKEEWEIVKDIEDYTLFIGKSSLNSDYPDINLYILYNTKHNVIELETSSLPRGLNMMYGSHHMVTDLMAAMPDPATIGQYDLLLNALDGEPTDDKPH